jgi:hypothetical protein
VAKRCLRVRNTRSIRCRRDETRSKRVEVFGLCLELAGELIDVGLPGADDSEVDDLGTVLLRDIGHRNRVFVDIPIQCRANRVIKFCLLEWGV